jgi:hypothetical protein
MDSKKIKSTLKKIYTILVLIKNIIIRKKKYTLQFVAEVDPNIKRWYYNFKHWGFNHAHLEMVCGADELCEYYANGNNQLTIKIIASKKRRNHLTNLYDEFVIQPLPKNTKFIDKYLYGRDYVHRDGNDGHKVKMWICPVTLFVLGRYPNYIYIDRTNLLKNY